ncbi:MULTISPECIES: glycine cleavage system protein H [Antrihabitans]|jgi:glycine cleavage system H protein|uniref:Glycine cleavage system protein H n=2 Tax=Antrihabitans TaxID=2799491 RepID=A0A934NUR8_9NOCA|nr:glycine cleavage system protein H [Antrihabitans stalagmiti]MBJ8341919.1 glycine cleavage system protein H [Antrihabitans stalagmiti]
MSVEHDWLTIATSRNFFESPVRVSLSPDAAKSVGAVTALELPTVGTFVEAGMQCGAATSAANTTGLFSPVSGRVTIVNDEVGRHPELTTSDPGGAGWLFAVLPSHA